MTSGSRCIHYIIKRALSKPIIKQTSTNLSLLFLSLDAANSTGPVACSDSHHPHPQLSLYSPPSTSHETSSRGSGQTFNCKVALTLATPLS